jgi:hypothetical protein
MAWCGEFCYSLYSMCHSPSEGDDSQAICRQSFAPWLVSRTRLVPKWGSLQNSAPRHLLNRLRLLPTSYLRDLRGSARHPALPFSPSALLSPDVFGTSFFSRQLFQSGVYLRKPLFCSGLRCGDRLTAFPLGSSMRSTIAYCRHSSGFLGYSHASRTTKPGRPAHERARRHHTSTAAFYHTCVHHCHSIFWPPPENCRRGRMKIGG